MTNEIARVTNVTVLDMSIGTPRTLSSAFKEPSTRFLIVNLALGREARREAEGECDRASDEKREEDGAEPDRSAQEPADRHREHLEAQADTGDRHAAAAVQERHEPVSRPGAGAARQVDA